MAVITLLGGILPRGGERRLALYSREFPVLSSIKKLEG